ncbi:MAG: large-conductance mechanosensitive channel protein MscL [Acholeplasmataceae bacterium]|nr:large-conductance mechanosensitive channel protein MscL [Acholeplasmataceae bacterium]
MRKFFKDFAAFIKRGNVLDLAVGIIIGAAFNAIVSSLVNDILMPVIGLIGGKNISEASVVLVPAVVDSTGAVLENAVTLNYGAFIQSIIDFFIIALTIFVVIRFVSRLQNRRKQKEEPKVVEKKPSAEDLLTEIRDLLKNKPAEE